MKRWRKALLLGAIAYVLIPFDAIPDTIPLLGWLDDVGFLSLAVAAVWRDVKRHSEQIAAREDTRRRGADIFDPVA